MTDLPSQIDKRVRREIAALTRPWKLVKTRDHYFIRIEDQPMICVANNSSKRRHWDTKMAIRKIRKAADSNSQE